MTVKISEVFTPRSSTVNLKVYVPRLNLETGLARSIQGSLHTILHGESGNGKSWLYKKVFTQLGFHFKVANCANASRMGSVASAICAAIAPRGNPQQIEMIGDAGEVIDHQEDPLYKAMKRFRRDISSGDAVIVLDNLEAIFDDGALMNELANILLLLDDQVYGALNIKFLLVGVPNGILEYFAKTKNIESVANRLQEIPKVGSLNLPMVETLIRNGLNEQLKYNLLDENIQEISRHICFVTLGVAQRVQEYWEPLKTSPPDATAANATITA